MTSSSFFLLILALTSIPSIFCQIKAADPETRHPISDRIFEKYIELSMNLTVLFKDTSVEESALHELSKKIISQDGNEDKIQKILDKFMDSLDEKQKKEFGELYFDKIKLDYITKKVHRVLGFYLTKHQIERLRDVLQKQIEAGATRAEYVEAMVEELTKEISREKAVKAVENTMKDLKIFGKKNPGWVEKVEQWFHKATAVHDEI